jgi:hypothetical protein
MLNTPGVGLYEFRAPSTNLREKILVGSDLNLSLISSLSPLDTMTPG